MSSSLRQLDTIQKKSRLNDVYAADQPGPGNGNHVYEIHKHNSDEVVATISFQCGPRNDANSVHGIIDADLLEIVRDRLEGFQNGTYASEYNANALKHIEEALLWMNRRVADREQRGVLGTYNK